MLAAISEAWRDRRPELLESAERIAGAIAGAMSGPGGSGGLVGGRGAAGRADLATTLDLSAPASIFPAGLTEEAAERVLAQWDSAEGGFRGAPKFPPAAILEFLLRGFERTGRAAWLEAVSLTLDRMGRGGIFDQLAGGFARYSVDAYWHVPHFEKMLDDNAQLLRVYAHHARLTGSAFSHRVAEQTAEFLLADLRLPDGSFAASLDADTAGVEGGTYLWTPEELEEVLGPSDAAVAAALFHVKSVHPAELTGSVLQLPADPADVEIYERLRARLHEARSARPQPARDELVVLRTNALAVGALAEAGAALGQPDWIDAAAQAADYLTRVHRGPDGWLRSSVRGEPGSGRAQLSDVAELAAALLALHQATSGPAALDDALGVLDDALRDYHDGAGWWDAPHQSEGELFLRPRDPTDGAAPSGTSTMAGALLTAAALTDRSDLRSASEQILAGAADLAAEHPRAAGWYLAVAEAMLAGPLQIAVAGSPGNDLLSAARRLAPGGSVVVGGVGDDEGVVLLADRFPIDGRAAAYVCHGFVCDRPVLDVAALTALVRPHGPVISSAPAGHA